MKSATSEITQKFTAYITDQAFPCIAAKAAVSKGQIKYFEASSIHCPSRDKDILQFIYDFVDEYKKSNQLYQSAVVIFSKEDYGSEEMFEASFWRRLQNLRSMDAVHFPYDSRVEQDPESDKFSFSLKEEAFFIIALHPHSSRPARQFSHPVLVFNPHAQFEQLRAINKYDRMKQTVRSRDLMQNGSINPMLEDFGAASEVYQYSGKKYEDGWKCPLHIKHKNENNITEKRYRV